ncbi:MAG: hypothetical protein V4695_01335 [Pseudomonadota bacterium]
MKPSRYLQHLSSVFAAEQTGSFDTATTATTATSQRGSGLTNLLNYFPGKTPLRVSSSVPKNAPPVCNNYRKKAENKAEIDIAADARLSNLKPFMALPTPRSEPGQAKIDNQRQWKQWADEQTEPKEATERRLEAVAALHAYLSNAPLDAKLSLAGMGLVTLPPGLPKGIRVLSVSGNHLGRHSRPYVPASLKTLNISSNEAEYLPVLPPTLTTLNARCNQLTALPVLPASLRVLIVDKNRLQILPALPENLEVLKADVDTLERTLRYWHSEVREAGKLTKEFMHPMAQSIRWLSEEMDNAAVAEWEMIVAADNCMQLPSVTGSTSLMANAALSGALTHQTDITHKQCDHRERNALDERITVAMDQISILEMLGVS